jgi:PAS domain S-box-containing protein
MRRFKDIILISAVYTVLLVATFFLPLWITVPAGVVIASALILRRRAEHKRKIEQIQNRLSNLRSEGLFIEGKVKSTDDDVFYRMILTLLTDLERSLFKLVEKNIQLLSLKEIGRNIISSLDEQKLIDSVFDYLIRGVRYREAAFVLLRRKKQCFQAIVCIEKPTRMIRRVINFGFGDLDGTIYNSFVSGKPFLIKDVKMHPLTDFAGEQLFPGSTMTSYIIAPLMKSTEEIHCFESPDCLLRKLADGEGTAKHEHYLSRNECMACPDIPFLGALIVTDGFRATPLTNIDQVTIETVGSLVSSNIENWMLYQELRQEEVFRENVFEGMINGVFVVDLNGKITLANRRARELSFYGQNEILGMGINDLVVDATQQPQGESPIIRVLAESSPLAFHEAYLKRMDAVHIPIRMNVSPLIGEDKEMQGAIIEFVDVSDIKRLEEEVRQLDRLAVLGRFTSAVAHEIRNPLTGIAAGIQYLNRDEQLSGDQRENISFILTEVDRLNRIITDLLKVGKPHRLNYQEVKLDDVVRRGYQSVNDLFDNKGIDFQIEMEENLPMIEIDPDQILQVLINLLKNSAEAVDHGGRVKIAGKVYRGEDREVMLEKDRDMICIEIRDNGAGMERSDRERVFEPFFSRKKGGTGLGLFVTHSIIQHHQGRITVDSEPDNGSAFRVYLPITRPGKGEEVETGSTAG